MGLLNSLRSYIKEPPRKFSQERALFGLKRGTLDFGVACTFWRHGIGYLAYS